MPSNSFYNEFDRGRVGPRPPIEDHRTAFQCDRDGVIYSSAFRRLQAKTQVFLSGEYDFYRTRLTHSIEVAQIGRAICNYLAIASDFLRDDFFIDGDLVEAVCLAHDIGHPPFGHAGERTLHRLMREGYGGFEGNAQSLKILTETIYSAGAQRRGLNPTRAFLDGILKYKSLFSDLDNPANHFLYDDQAEWLAFAFADRDLKSDFAPGEALNGFRSIECQIMDWADDSAYSINDIVDSVNAGFMSVDTIRGWAEANLADAQGQAHIDKLCERVRGGKIEAWGGNKVGQFVHACRLVKRDTVMSDLTNRYCFALAIDPQVEVEVGIYKRLSYDLVFQSPKIHQLEYKGDQILTRVFEAFKAHYLDQSTHGITLLSPGFEAQVRAAADDGEKLRILCNYLAGMTDGFAVRTFKRLFDPDFGSIADIA